MQTPFTMDLLAEQMEVSQRTLIRRFKQAIGVKPTAYLQSLRIETAKRLLENSSLSLEDVVAQIGYVDVSSFRRLFKQRTNMTPREYRGRFAQAADLAA